MGPLILRILLIIPGNATIRGRPPPIFTRELMLSTAWIVTLSASQGCSGVRQLIVIEAYARAIFQWEPGSSAFLGSLSKLYSEVIVGDGHNGIFGTGHSLGLLHIKAAISHRSIWRLCCTLRRLPSRCFRLALKGFVDNTTVWNSSCRGSLTMTIAHPRPCRRG